MRRGLAGWLRLVLLRVPVPALALSLALLPAAAARAQDDGRLHVSGALVARGEVALGAFAAPVLKATRLNDQTAALAGARAALVLERRFMVGGGYYSSTPVEVQCRPAPGCEQDFRFSYYGAEGEVLFGASRTWHHSVQLLFGRGFVHLGEGTFSGGAEDTVAVSELTYHFNLRWRRWARVALGAGWRAVREVETPGLDDAALSGAAATVTLKLGRF